MNVREDKRSRGRPKTVDRQHAIEVAMDNYWQEGLHTLSLNELCRRVGISKPGLYREFGGEDGLTEAVLEHYHRLAIAPLLAAIAAEHPFAQVLEQIIIALTEPRGPPAGCLFTKMRLAAPRLGPDTTSRLRSMEQERRAAFEDWYQRALSRGEADPSLSPRFAAGYIDSQLTTVLTQIAIGEALDVVRAQARLALRVLLS